MYLLIRISFPFNHILTGVAGFTIRKTDQVNARMNNDSTTLQTTSGVVNKSIILQNSPNPFIEMTQLLFRMQESGEAVIRLIHSSGRIVHTVAGHYSKGDNAVLVHRSDLREPGFYLCRLETQAGMSTRKIMMY
jgi:hypothetical protein